jgi:hypothetical protein
VVSRVPYRRLIFAVFVVLVLAGLYAVTGSRHPASAAGQAVHLARAPVSAAVRLCAAPGSGGVSGGSVAIAAVPDSGAVSGSVSISPLTPGGSASAGRALATDTKPGVLQITSVPAGPALTKAQKAGQPGSSPAVTTTAGRGGVQVTAAGAMAQGLAVEQTAPGGLTTAQCNSPATGFWFAGPGQASAATIELYLMNAGNQAADAQVTALTDVTKGPPLLGNADNGITVPPHSMVEQSLGTLLQSSKVVALNVSSSVGQIVAAVRETKSGADDGNWLAPTQPPSRHLVIPGLLGTGGTRELYVAVPGTSAAQVKITAVTARGSYQPTGGTGIELLGGSAQSLSLPSLGGVAGAVVISSSVPVTASMLMSGGPAGTPGVVAVSSQPVLEQGVLADNPAHPAGSTQLVLSAPRQAATVRVVTATADISAAGQAGKVVQIKAGSSVLLPVRPPSGSKATAFTVVVTPLSGSGPVYAARIISFGGTVQSVLPVPSSPTWVPLSPVQDSLSAVLGSRASS